MSIDSKETETRGKNENRIYFKNDVHSELSGLFLMSLLPSPHESLNAEEHKSRSNVGVLHFGFLSCHGKSKSKNMRIRKKRQQ